MIKPGLYRHYKDKLYRVIGIARHSETHEELVVYHDENFGLWARPLTMFQETIEVNGKKQARFQFVGPLFETAPDFRP
jgi:hypothetical protein